MYTPRACVNRKKNDEETTETNRRRAKKRHPKPIDERKSFKPEMSQKAKIPLPASHPSKQRQLHRLDPVNHKSDYMEVEQNSDRYIDRVPYLNTIPNMSK